MRLIDKLAYSQNWNIGFCEMSPDDLLNNKALGKIQWMKHPYRDRWFADPFILEITKNDIVVFVEECQIEHPKGIISELVIDRATKTLKQRYVLLELDSHLSYPAILKNNGRIYVYPENGASGKLNIYEYDEVNHRLINPVCMLNQAVADSTIVEWQGKYQLVATRYPDTQEKAYLYCSSTPTGPYELRLGNPFQTSRAYSRPAGNWVIIDNKLYRPAQDCSTRYGAGISMMNVSLSGDTIQEKCVFRMSPISRKYSRGVHTINFLDNLCVIDGYGYKYPYIGASIFYLRRIKHSFIR